MSSGAALRFKLVPSGDGMRLTATAGKEVWEAAARPRELESARKDHYAFLEGVKETLKRHRADDPAGLQEAMVAMQRRSRTLVRALAHYSKRRSFKAFCEDALRSARAERRVPRIDVVTRSDMPFPFELLVLFEDEWPERIDDERSLHQACSCFVGYFAAVRRILVDQDELPAGAAIGENGRIRLSYLQYADLAGAVQEWEFFDGQPRIVTDDEPWPGDEVDTDAIPVALGRQIFDPRRRLDGTLGEPVHVQHFACHCLTADADSAEHLVALGRDEAFSEVKLGVLQEVLDDEGDEPGDDPPRPGPLVFLNACGTSVVRPEALSFPMFFLENRNLGFIGAEVAVPDLTAARFSIDFYDALLRDRTAGEALVDAKQALVWADMNPLGLLWTMYADPELRVAV